MRSLIGGSLLAASTVGARIVGPDDRIPLDPRLEAPFSGVGRLVCRDPGTGERFATTAALVGDRVTVLAVGHFGRVQKAEGGTDIPVDYCAFELRSAQGKRMFGSLIAPEPVARFSARAKPNPYTADWAILRLNSPAPASALPVVLKPISARDLARRSDVFMVSFHSSPDVTARTKRFSPSCKPSAIAGEPLVFRHSCDTQPGSSGGLLYIMSRSGPRAVGMNHGSATDRNWNYGQVISHEMIRNLPPQGVDTAP